MFAPSSWDFTGLRPKYFTDTVDKLSDHGLGCRRKPVARRRRTTPIELDKPFCGAVDPRGGVEAGQSYLSLQVPNMHFGGPRPEHLARKRRAR